MIYLNLYKYPFWFVVGVAVVSFILQYLSVEMDCKSKQ